MTSWVARPRGDVALSMSPPEFVGRSREMAAFAQAMTQQPTVVLIEGEAGIGKTRLVNEYQDPGDTRTALMACCPGRG